MKAIFYEGEIQDNYIGHIMAEVYKDRVYDPFLMGKSNLTIFDIGGNIGITANYFSDFGKVYSFEPSKEHFSCLSKMVEFNGLQDKIIPVNKAVYIKDGKLPFFHNPNRTMYSLHSAVYDGKSEVEEVDCVALDTFINENKIEHIDFMKLDVEGSETEIISSSSFKNISDKIDTIVAEVHAWSGRNPNQIIDALKMRGFNISQLPSDATIIVAKR